MKKEDGKMYKAYRFRMYPSAEQEQLMAKTFGCCRFLHNRMLADKIEEYKKTGKMLVCVNPKWYRPTDVVNLWGDPTKAKTKLGWNPQKTSCEQLCAIMAQHDLELAKKELSNRK